MLPPKEYNFHSIAGSAISKKLVRAWIGLKTSNQSTPTCEARGGRKKERVAVCCREFPEFSPVKHSTILSNKHARYPQVKLGPSRNWITQKCVALLEISMFNISSFLPYHSP